MWGGRGGGVSNKGGDGRGGGSSGLEVRQDGRAPTWNASHPHQAKTPCPPATTPETCRTSQGPHPHCYSREPPRKGSAPTKCGTLSCRDPPSQLSHLERVTPRQAVIPAPIAAGGHPGVAKPPDSGGDLALKGGRQPQCCQEGGVELGAVAEQGIQSDGIPQAGLCEAKETGAGDGGHGITGEEKKDRVRSDGIP